MATCAHCKKLKILGGVTKERLFFCSDKCFHAWKASPEGVESKSTQVDSPVGRILGAILIGIGSLGILGFMVQLASTGKFVLPLFPLIILMVGMTVFNRSNPKKS